MVPYFRADGIDLYCGDGLSLMGDLSDSSINLIVVDPPYFRVKGKAWDRQWDDAEAFLAWIGALCREWHRLLKPNGSLYVFASPKLAARVEVSIGEWFEVLNHIVWCKHDGTPNEGGSWSHTNKEQLRHFFGQTERIIFAEHHGANSAKGGYGAKCDELREFVFEPLRAYLDGERKRARVDKAACNEACGFSPTPGGMASRHYFSQSQWCLPTEEHYHSLQRLFNRNGDNYYLPREYEDLRGKYEDLRGEYENLRGEYEDLRRPFFVTSEVPYTDVWDFPTVQSYPGKHLCEKPLTMMEHIIRVSSRPGDVVLDCCAGSGTTLLAARNLGRKAIGIELNQEYCDTAIKRLSQ